MKLFPLFQLYLVSTTNHPPPTGQDRGPVLEVIVSRTNFISAQTKTHVRVVGLSTALANAQDLADWLNIKQVRVCRMCSVCTTVLLLTVNGYLSMIKLIY